MNVLRSSTPRRIRPSLRWLVRVAAGVVLVATPFAGPTRAGGRTAFEARAGLELAQTAARSWAPDAVLIYVENDETLDAAGGAPRWGYLFHSQGRSQSRAYSVRDQKILVAETLAMKFEAPPLNGPWIDSGAALGAALQEGGQDFCRDHSGHPSTMLLMRGAFHDEHPDEPAWTVVFSSDSAPSLFVMVDANDGRVRRKWRG